MSAQIPQKHSTPWRLPPRICGPHTYLSRGSHSHRDGVALEGEGRSFRELAEKHKGTQCLLKMRHQRGGHILFQDVLRPPQVRGEFRALAAAPAWERSLVPALGEPQALVLPAGPRLRDFLQNHFWAGVKLIKKRGDT